MVKFEPYLLCAKKECDRSHCLVSLPDGKLELCPYFMIISTRFEFKTGQSRSTKKTKKEVDK